MTFDLREIESALASVERIALLLEKVRPGDTRSLSRGLAAQADGMRSAVAHMRSLLGIEVEAVAS